MRAKLPGVLLALGTLVLLVGAVAGMFGLAEGLGLRGEPWATPGSRDLNLDTGRWVLYERAPDEQAEPEIPLRRIAVYGPTGTVPLSCASCAGTSQSLTLGSTSYVGVASFQVEQAGSYRITVTEPGQVVMVAPSMVGGLLAFMGGFLLALAGAVLCFVALAWLVVAAVTRRS